MENDTDQPAQVTTEASTVDNPRKLLSAKASRKTRQRLTDTEIEVAEEEAEAWARKVNSC